MSRARTTFILGLLGPLLPLALVGCSDDPQPKVAPEPTESASETTLPSATSGGSPRSAGEQFIEEYVSTISDAISTGDTSTFLAMSAVSCQSCHALARNLQTAYEQGGRITGGKWTVKTADFVRRQKDLGDVWNVDVLTAKEHWVDGEGKTTKVVRSGVEKLGVALSRKAGEFEVVEMRLR